MGTKNYDSATDMITFTRASSGTALRKVTYGPELVTNGDFATDTSWTKGTGWTIGSGVATHAAGTGSDLYQAGAVIAGKMYTLTLDVTTVRASSTLYVMAGSTNTYQIIEASVTVGQKVAIFIGPANGRALIRLGGPADVDIDNITVKETTFDQADGALELFNSPADIPRIEYNADGTVKGLLAENAGTNLIPDMHGLTIASSRISKVSTTAPDGSNNAEEYSIASGTGYPYLYKVVAISSGTTYTHSIFVKLPTGTPNVNLRYVTITTLTTFPANEVIFDLQEGVVVGTPDMPDYLITSYGNGWYRLSATNTADATSSNSFGFILWPLSDSSGTRLLIENHDVGDKVFEIYGPQTEAGSFASSYIPTTGSTATRAVDVATIPTSAFGYNSNAGSVVVEVVTPPVVDTAQNYLVSSNNASARWIYSNANNRMYMYDGTNQANAYTVYVNSTQKYASSSNQITMSIVIGGGTLVTNAANGNIPSLTTAFYIGGYYISLYNWGGHIKSLKYYPRKLSNAQLQELTT